MIFNQDIVKPQSTKLYQSKQLYSITIPSDQWYLKAMDAHKTNAKTRDFYLYEPQNKINIIVLHGFDTITPFSILAKPYTTSTEHIKVTTSNVIVDTVGMYSLVYDEASDNCFERVYCHFKRTPWGFINMIAYGEPNNIEVVKSDILKFMDSIQIPVSKPNTEKTNDSIKTVNLFE
jgi:hypothetical protein